VPKEAFLISGVFTVNRRIEDPKDKEIADYVKNAYGPISQRAESCPSPECPPTENLQAFACGILDRKTAEDLFLHVAGCCYCGPQLKAYLDAIDMQPSLWERFLAFWERIPGLGPMLSFFQQRPAWRWISISGLAASVLCVTVVPPAINVYELNQAQKYVAAYYSEKPSTEMRVTWFSGHPKSTRPILAGTGRSSSEGLNRERAQILVLEHLKSDNPQWSLVRARLQLVESNQQDLHSAIVLLQSVQAKGLNDPATQNDLATAYYQMGCESDPPNPVALNESLRILTKMLDDPKLSPADQAVAEYNIAIVYERLHLLENAMEHWDSYLELDQTSAWRAIAQQRLEAIKKKSLRPSHPNTEQPHFF
jgi:tetratricopeptide (TPR) repeat protein